MTSAERAEREEGLPGVLDPVRLAAVHSSGLLDRAGVESLDQLAAVAARVLDAPVAFVTVVDDRRSWWVSCVGVASDPSVPRQNAVEESFCQYVVADEAAVFIEDAARHPRTRDNPAVKSLGVRAWAGFPLIGPNGDVLGSFCVVDTKPRRWSASDVELLGMLARAASAQVGVVSMAAAELAARDDADRERAGKHWAAAQVQRLALMALRLVAAETEEELLDVVVNDGPRLFGADGGALVVRDDNDALHAVLSKEFNHYDPEPFRTPFNEARLPGRHVARTGRRLLIPNRAAGLAFSADMADVYDRIGHSAWACLPLRVGSRLLGSLSLSWIAEREFDADDVGLLDGFAAQCSQALEHVRLLRAEREQTVALRDISEALQRSLLTRPPIAESFQIAVRYQPAAEQAQVGGDWHDAFVTASGSTMVVVGDVTGHDGIAAAAMGQIRNVLRGMAYDSDDGPSALLTRLDGALQGLEVDALATAILARIEHVPEPGTAGTHRLRWCNAGHPPPLLRRPDGSVQVLAGEPELLLGLDVGANRREMTADLVPGTTLLFYTDGLVEGRQTPLDEGIDRLGRLFGAAGGADLDQLCETLLAAEIGADNTDDIALLALYCRPADGPLPGTVIDV